MSAKKEKADLLFLRGKCYDYIPEYTKQAEENLSKAIKLMPSKAEAWEALGHVYWKKRDLEQAKKTFEGSLEQDENNKVAMRNLSMVYRMLEKSSTNPTEPIDAEEKKANFAKSIELAKAAIKLDMGDSQSWYVLGNAHLTNFFANNESTKELEQSLKAYQLAEKNLKEPNPDLYFNRGTVLEYLERYSESAADFMKAHAIDPNLGAERRADGIIGFVSRAYNAISNKGKIKTNRLIDMVKSIPTVLPESMQESAAKQNLKVADISQLQHGDNPELIISAKVVNSLDKQIDVPQCFLMVDSKHNFCVLSVYHMSKKCVDKMRAGSALLIRNPHLVLTQLQFKGYQYNYQCIKVTDVNSLLVNGAALTDDAAKSEVISKTFA